MLNMLLESGSRVVHHQKTAQPYLLPLRRTLLTSNVRVLSLLARRGVRASKGTTPTWVGVFLIVSYTVIMRSTSSWRSSRH